MYGYLSVVLFVLCFEGGQLQLDTNSCSTDSLEPTKFGNHWHYLPKTDSCYFEGVHLKGNEINTKALKNGVTIMRLI